MYLQAVPQFRKRLYSNLAGVLKGWIIYLPPVTSTICSPQSNRPGPNSKLPWFLYNLEYHLKNPAAKFKHRFIIRIKDGQRTESTYGNIICRGDYHSRACIRKALKNVEDRNKECKKGTCKHAFRVLMTCTILNVDSLKAVCERTLRTKSTSRLSKMGEAS